jgi:hypothetical protein
MRKQSSASRVTVTSASIHRGVQPLGMTMAAGNIDVIGAYAIQHWQASAPSRRNLAKEDRSTADRFAHGAVFGR